MPSPTTTETMTVNVSPSYKCWRMAYDPASKKVQALFEAAGTTKTAQSLFCSDPTDGTTTGFVTSAAGNAECMAQITALGLSYTPRATKPAKPAPSAPKK
jgi:hypothetical protein